jgi:hypothetical protein
MSFGLDEKERRREKRLRRRILMVLFLCRQSPMGGVNARTLVEKIEETMNFEGDGHALALVRDLVGAGYASEKPLPRRRGEDVSLDSIFVSITDKGTKLWREAIPADPLIEDNRAETGGVG